MKTRRFVYYRHPRQVAAEVQRCVAAAGITKEEAAARIGVDRSYLNRVAAGTRPASLALQESLVSEFGADARAFAEWGAQEIGEMVRLARAEMGVSASFLAELSGVSRRVICYTESGERLPSRRSLANIATALVALADDKHLVCEPARDLAVIVKQNSIFAGAL